MEKYFSRLRRRPKSQPTEVMQLSKFHKSWSYIQTIYLAQEKKQTANVYQTPVPGHLKTLADLLVDEEIRQEEGQTGVCMEYLLRNGILVVLVNLAAGDYPSGVRGEVVRFVTTLINLLDDKFLVHNAVFKPTLKLIRGCVEDPVASELYHEDLVDLMYVICSKIHGFPDLLNIFFHDRTWLNTPMKRAFPRIPDTPMTAVPSTSTHPSSSVSGMASPVTGLSSHSASASFAPSPSSSASSFTSTASTSSTATLGNPSPTPSPNPSSPPARRGLIASSTAPSASSRRGSLLFPSSVAISGSSAASSSSTHPTITTSHHDGSGGGEEHPVPDYEFLLFTYLLRFLHREGQSGDYARTALLFILELADGALGEFVLHASSFPAVAAAAVGALYSQLPRALAQPGSEEAEDKEAGEEFHEGLDGFVKSLEFCQDILARCPTPGIGEALLRNVQAVFLENILWPSLQSCVESDGSAEAVFSYVDVVLRVVTKQPTLKVMIQRFLRMRGNEEIRSQGDLEDNDEEDSPTDGFDLKRLLIHTILSPSTSSTTLTAALNLLSTIITRHCECAWRFIGGKDVEGAEEEDDDDEDDEDGDGTEGSEWNPQDTSGLSGDLSSEDATPVARSGFKYDLNKGMGSPLDEDPIEADEARRVYREVRDGEGKVMAHRFELALYMSALASLDPSIAPDSPEFLSSYEAYLGEAECALSCCRPTHLAQALSRTMLEDGNSGSRGEAKATEEAPRKYRVDGIREALPRRLLELLAGYWRQSRHLNLAISGVIASMATCPLRLLDGWMTCTPLEEGVSGTSGMTGLGLGPVGHGIGDAASAAHPSLTPPLLYRTLELLVAHVSDLRRQHPTFDRVLSERRRGLLCHAVLLSDGGSSGVTQGIGEGSVEGIVDGTVTLEEMIKEWIGIIQARRGLGMDV
ncbi:Retinoic acid induced 16-like protein-domain-containing protein [Piptocephalis cylindrospora]|uniref:Retinoic acid induced 16-like protein-domain-containing protein n=1 Tax=Piptocephalis cylindrospora TaxID=1907219 RepID=A0A4P9Y5Y5_9FUNG|nr:Retinoic acid induced 16-like protein-domain-containing protein [Piptocephalis cylindrospora]|eukprot:RKP14466.1 Retinoic acid induced 16-like protein-domain-containing protein [Piptocephalis cylindrospora]